MHLTDLARLAVNGIRTRKLRSGLTALGIIIGAAAFVALVSMGAGIEDQVLGQFGDFGADHIRVTTGVTSVEGGPPDFGNGGPAEVIRFTKRDHQAVASVAGIRAVLGTASDRASVEFRQENINLAYTGVEPQAWIEIDDPELIAGRLLRPSDGRSIVIGEDLATIFATPIGVNQQLLLDSVRFRVVGIIDGGESIFMPLDEAHALAGHDEFTGITALKIEDAEPGPIALQIEAALLRSRELTPAEIDFTVTTAEDLQEAIASITATITIFLGSIAGISLLVGGIGIANTMFMTVMERSKQIGILKAVGMTRQDVVLLFLFESALLGLLGGLLGAGLGAAAATILAPPGADDFVTPPPSPTIIVGMTLFSMMIGSIAGVIPAFRAASVTPMQALQA